MRLTLKKPGRRTVDPRILGQILAAQNFNFVLPDTRHIAEFYAETLTIIPGSAACRVCLGGFIVQKGEMDGQACAACPVFHQDAVGQLAHYPTLEGVQPKCRLEDQPDIYGDTVTSLYHSFGFFLFRVTDPDVFNIYRPFISNLANNVALSLENRLQREMLQKSQLELEHKVEERTSELKKANAQLQHDQALLSRIMETSPVGITLVDLDGHITFANSQAEKVLGLSRDEITRRTYNAPDWNVTAPGGGPISDEDMPFKQVLSSGRPIYDAQHMIQRPDGSRLFLSINGAPILNEAGEIASVIFTVENITRSKQAEDALREREQHSQSLLRLSRRLEQAQSYADILTAAQDEVKQIIGYQNLWAYIFTADKKQAKILYAKGPISEVVMSEERVTTLKIEGDRMMEEIVKSKGMVVVEDALLDERTDKHIVAILGNRSLVNVPILLFDRHLGSVGMGTFREEGVLVPTVTQQEYLMTMAGHIAVALDRIHHLDERKKAADDLQQSNDLLRAIIESAPTAIIGLDLDGKVRQIWNAAAEKMLGWSAEEVMGKVLPSVPSEKDDEFRQFSDAIRSGKTLTGVEVSRLRRDGTPIDYSIFASPLYNPDGQIDGNIAVMVDITERKQHERERESIISVSSALRKANTRTEILDVILDQLIALFNAEGAVLALPDPQKGGLIYEMGRGVVGKRMVGLSIPPGMGISNWVISNKQTYLNNRADIDPRFYHANQLGSACCVIAAPLATQDLIVGALWIARRAEFGEKDIHLFTAVNNIAANAIHRVTLHEQTEQQLQRLIGLHQIDLAISANFDLNVTLKIILGIVKEELHVDAASILLLSPVTHTLDYAAGIGFRTHTIELSHVRLGTGCAGRAAQDLRTVSSLETQMSHETFNRFSFLSGENFTSHYATPLVVKGQVKGVLEIFHRGDIEPEHTWLGYFETLATQAAIAIDNAALFRNLQRSNMELVLAYDATIEGWSRAMDLRDRETEGHTQRVAEMALALAEKMGLSDAEKLDLRRGALLHDIGKMGIPDTILLKPGPLSDDEWKIMRQHPVFAYHMLSPIKYLQSVLDIPYCHHEKWDGSGYPRGLKGSEIPLFARMFSVVDVYDALTSDRPYSKAWPHEKACALIRDQSGKQFDPQVVDIFLDTL